MIEALGERVIPVPLEVVIRHLRVEDDLEPIERQLIDSYIEAAVEHAAAFTRRELFQQRYRMQTVSAGAIPLERSPVAEVESVTVDGVELDPETYRLDQGRWPHVLRIDSPPAGAAVIDYVAGYTSETLPRQIRQAVLLTVGHWYAHREEVVVGSSTSRLPMAAHDLMWMQRMEL